MNYKNNILFISVEMSNTNIGIENIADKIEKKLNEEDEENEETFDDWFKSYINLVETKRFIILLSILTQKRDR